MKKAMCKNCGSLPVEEFYQNLSSPNKTPMRVCKKCHARRTTTAQSERRKRYRLMAKAEYQRSEVRHGLKSYWAGCRCELCLEARSIHEREKYEKREKGYYDAVQVNLFIENQIRLLARKGTTRDSIYRVTRAPMDLIVDKLAEMWDRGEVVIKRHGEDRRFYLKAA